MKFKIYCDGGCHGNPGPMGIGAVITPEEGEEKTLSVFLGHGTNNIAEIEAARRSLSLTPPGSEVLVITDSQYVVMGATQWRKGWERRGWRNSSNKPVANRVKWQGLFEEIDARKVSFSWVRGHNGDVNNERADVLATEAIERGKNE